MSNKTSHRRRNRKPRDPEERENIKKPKRVERKVDDRKREWDKWHD